MRRLIILLLTACPLFAQEPPPKPWTSAFGAGLALTSGNTSTRNYNLSLTTKYDPKTRLLFKAEALYILGKSDGVKQVDKATADAREEYTLSDRTFTFGEVSYLRDPFKGISYSVAPVAGVGYRIFKSDRRTLSVDGAGGAIFENDLGIGRSSSGALKGGENFEWAISPSSKLTQKITGIWKTKDFADSLYHFDAGLTTTIATRAELKLAYNYDYKNRPPSAAIKKGDSALFAAVLLKF
jgi:putative salt-induced outer membrane protein YdiY